MIEISISQDTKVPFDRELIHGRALHAFSLMGLGDQLVTLNLCTDEEMQALNRRYRALDSTTDVLSFNLDYIDPQSQQYYLGDIVISLPKAQQQALEHHQTLEDEIIFLLIHGLLHLQGYDHADVQQEQSMFALQENIFSQVVGNK